jgi:hypothetical protein
VAAHDGRVDLTEAQIAAAGALHASLTQWRLTDDALRRLQDALPAFGPEESLLKVVAINGLYGTNVFALVRTGEHVERVLAATDLGTAGPELVESLADVTPLPGGRLRRHVSFASKFAHFFISADRFPIFDSYADRMMLLHVGSSAVRNPARPYEAFVANLARLKREQVPGSSYRELDRYLWLAGLYRAYLDGRRTLNAEALRIFEKPSPEQRRMLQALRPEA